MTYLAALQLCQIATAYYGKAVITQIDGTFTAHTDTGYRVILTHKTLGRQIALREFDGWEGVKDAWSAALEARR